MKTILFSIIIIFSLQYKAYCQCEFLIEDSLLANITAFSYESKPAFVDIDNDGDMDAFVGERDGKIYFYKNTGNANNALFIFENGSSNPFDSIDVLYRSTPAFVDIDNDGDMDAFIGEYDGTINYYKNTGSANNPVFTLQVGSNNPFDGVNIGDDSTPTFVDIDNDGDKDAFIGEEDGIINFYTNTGSASSPVFTLQVGSNNPFDGVDIGENSTPTFVDIDNDGDMDAFIGEKDGITNFYANTGSASNPVFTLQVGSNDPFDGVNIGDNSAPSFTDIDNDGDMDAFIGKKHGSIILYKNNGSASSPAFSFQSDSSNPLVGIDVGFKATPAFVDIDNDGDMDAFIGEDDGNINYYKIIGNATSPIFTLQSGSNNPFDGIDVGSNSAPVFIDIDNDGDMDAFIGEYDGTINYYKNTGSISNPIFTLQSGSNNPFDGIDVGYNAIPAFVDIDNDGDMDVFIGEAYGYINYYKNIGNASSPVFSLQSGSNNPFDGIDVGGGSSPTLLDIDNDGDMDAFIGEYDGTINYYKNTGSASSPVFILQVGSNNPFDGVDIGDDSTPTFVDIDNDGDLDAFIGENGGIIYFLKNTGNVTNPIMIKQNQHKNPFNDVDIWAYYIRPTFVDIDNDEDMDVFIGGYYGEIYYFENLGNKYYPAYFLLSYNYNEVNGMDVGTNSAPTFVDIDYDGDMDAFIGEWLGEIYFYKNTGSASNPVFTLQSGSNNPFNGIDVGMFSTPTFTDIDNDGDMDAFIGENDGNINYYKNTGNASSPVFSLQSGSNDPFNGMDVGTNSAPTFTDIDNDGDMDAFIGESLGEIYFYKNTGNANNPIYTPQVGSDNPLDGIDIGDASTPTFVDIDYDGDMDIFIGDRDGRVNFIENKCKTVITSNNDLPNTNEVNSILIYPNPSSSIVNVENIVNNSLIQLVDVLGKKIEIDISYTSNTACQFSISNLPNGIYFLQVKDNKGMLKSKPVVKI